MTLLHMDTDEINELARYLSRAANEIIDSIDDLRRSAIRLDARWHGGRSDHILRQISSAARSAENLASDATQLSRRVRHEVDDWLEADRTGAGRVLGSVAPLPMPVPTPTPRPRAPGENGAVDQSGSGEGMAERLQEVWDAVEVLLGIIAAGAISSQPGGTYAGQVIITGPGWAKELLNLSPNLTHIKIGNLPSHISRGLVTSVSVLALVAPTLQLYEHWLEMLVTPHDDNLRIGTAMFIDTWVIYGLHLSLTIGGAAAGSKIVALIGGAGGAAAGTGAAPGPGTVAGGGGGLAIGMVIGGAVGAIIGGQIASSLVDAYLKWEWRDKGIDVVTNLLRQVGGLFNVSQPQGHGE